MTNIEYLKKNNLFEAHKHFMRLVESPIATFPEEEIEEAGENDQDPMAGGDQNAMGGDPNAMGGQDPMGGGGMPQDPNAMGGDPNAMGADPMGGDMGADPTAGGDQNAMGEDPNAMGADPMGGDMGADPMAGDPMGDADLEDDGDTIDIDGLTKAEDKLNIKQNQIGRDLSKVDDRISTLIDSIKNLLTKVDSNNSEIEALKAEFEKRNPTQTEKLNLRSLDSYPFNVKPTDYWAEKAKQGGYEAYSDNAEPTTKEYVITNDDVDNPSDDIADTFFKIDDDDIQTLEKMFNI